MKKMKFFAAFTALAIVILGSAFTKKPTAAGYGFVSQGTHYQTGSNWFVDVKAVRLTTAGLVSSCPTLTSDKCQVDIEETSFLGADELQNTQDDLIYIKGQDSNNPEQTIFRVRESELGTYVVTQSGSADKNFTYHF